MRKSFHMLATWAAAAGLGMAFVLPLPAPASVSIAAGGYLRSNPSGGGTALILSSGASIPAVPLEVQGSLFTTLSGQRHSYAFTGEIRGFTGGGYGGAYVGAGVGLGNLSSDGSSAAVLTIFAGKSIAPLTSIELRLYRQTQASGQTAGFAGVRFSF
jgi:hypothetical protein